MTTLEAVAEPRTVHLMGGEITTLVSTADTDGQWSMLLFTMPAGLPGPVPHFHRTMVETFTVLEGQLLFVVEGRERTCGPNETVIVPKNAVHHFRNVGDTTARMLTHFTPGGLEDYFVGLAEIVATADTWPPTDLRPLAELMERHDSPVALSN